MKTEVLTLNKERNVTLTTYIQDCGEGFGCVAKRPAVLILPGGAYQMCSDREADPVAFAFAKAGYHVFINCRQNIALLHSLQDEILSCGGTCTLLPGDVGDPSQVKSMFCQIENKIAVIGFSAGGHLATAAATLAQNRPNAAILGYAVTSQHVQACNPNAPETISAVDRKTPPCFVFATRTDSMVPINNSIDFMCYYDGCILLFQQPMGSMGRYGWRM